MKFNKPSKKTVFIGRSTIDHTFLLDSFPVENTKVFARDYLCQYGGPALNAAITFNLLGGSARLISLFGNHESMIKVKNDLKSKYDLALVDLIKGSNYRIPESSVYVSFISGTRTIVNPPRQDYEGDINLKDINLAESSVILLDGFIFSKKLKDELSEARRSGSIIVLDGGSWKSHTSNILDIVDIAICSRKFLIPGKDVNQTISRMIDKGVGFIAITDNEKEIKVYQGGMEKSIPVPAINAVDTSGAGDVLHGAFCFYLSEGFNNIEALSRAALIASKSCCHFGTHTWREHETDQTR